MAGVAGLSGTLVLYLMLFIVQLANADDACEGYPQTVPGADREDVRGGGFENTFLNLAGRWTYRMEDGSVVVTRAPGRSFSGTIAGVVAVVAGLVALSVRRKGHPGVPYGLATLFAPPLGLVLALAAPRRTRHGPPRGAPSAL
ncbi:MAG: hypothetical protein AVDCRST_MAG02-1907 [uncultured Rubrobacteraceae bacterium]|uniref:Uncharacterized protein n=1 Tax=uncultured Rubrobacteraceae bacterium TaxID=349277 RepID=A0A6J4R6A0_9ACTN|nr:MAG: hypothetical protein AVDCRST_MAG02-1907 [uncultured Rubrobacteraceae bacterium]